MIRVEGLRRDQLCKFAVFVVFSAFVLASRCTSAVYAADEPPPAAESQAAAQEDDSGDRAASANDNSTSAEESAEEEGAEEPDDVEVEGEPAEETSEEPAPKAKEDQKDSVEPKKEKRIIGATATVQEKKSNLLFRARVDTGAKSCSLHVEDISIDDEEEKWADNVGKVVHFKVKNRNGESHYLDARIDGYVIIRTSESRHRRYKVPLTLRWKGVEKTVLVTLNDRNGMSYPLLLGRNFLSGDFLVDVDIDNDD